MSGYWFHRTNSGRVVYDRPINYFKERDIDRIVRKWTENQEPDVLFMSDIADRVLFAVARAVQLDRVTSWAANRLLQVIELIRGNVAPRITKEEQELLDWMSEMAGAVAPAEDEDRAAALARIRTMSIALVEWIDSQI